MACPIVQPCGAQLLTPGRGGTCFTTQSVAGISRVCGKALRRYCKCSFGGDLCTNRESTQAMIARRCGKTNSFIEYAANRGVSLAQSACRQDQPDHCSMALHTGHVQRMRVGQLTKDCKQAVNSKQASFDAFRRRRYKAGLRRQLLLSL